MLRPSKYDKFALTDFCSTQFLKKAYYQGVGHSAMHLSPPKVRVLISG